MSIYAVNGKVPVAAWIPSRDTAGNGTTTLNDLVGTNHGTLTNMDAGTDWVADTGAGGVRALDFDGVNDRINTGSVNTSAVSVSAWILLTANNLSYINCTQNASNTGVSWLLKINESAGEVGFAVVHSTTSLNIRSSTGVIPLNAWRHVVVTWSGGVLATTVTIYVNGSSITPAETTDGSGTKEPSSGLHVIAGRSFDNNRNMTGRLDDIRIFNTALNAFDVSQLYRNGNGRGVTANSNTFQIGMPI